jgi:hypothetical protein
MMTYLTREQEAERLLDVFGRDRFEPVLLQLQRQFDVLHGRAQVLLTLCGIVITVTGFSGRIIAQTGSEARTCVVAGLALVLLAGAIVIIGVLPLRWLTMHCGAVPRPWLDRMLELRDRKTRVYRLAIFTLLAGLILYVAALSMMLLSQQIARLPEHMR